jgi:subtilisin
MQRRDILCSSLAAALWLMSGSPAAAQRPSAEPPLVIDDAGRVRVIVQLAAGFVPEGRLPNQAARAAQRAGIAAAQGGLLARLEGADIAQVHRYQFIPYLALNVSAAALEELARSPQVAGVMLDTAQQPTITESIPLIDADLTAYPGTTTAVAVLDTGIDSGHPQLWQRVISEACYSHAGGIYSSLCPDGPDPGTDPDTAITGRGTGAPCGISGCSHGTHIGGIISGQLSQYQGVALATRLISIQIYSALNSPSGCAPQPAPCLKTFQSSELAGLERVYWLHQFDPTFAYYKIAAVNLSFGSGNHSTHCDNLFPAHRDAINNLHAAGIATVAASGNGSQSNALNFPACISAAVSVGNTTKDDTVWTTSNSASILDLLAPGTSITSPNTSGSYSAVTGTSFAAPHVAGAFAQLKHKRPTATVSQMLNALVSTGQPIFDPRNSITKPRIDVDNAVNVLP